MLEEIKKIKCEGYLLIHTHVNNVKPSHLPLRVRWQLKSRFKSRGFLKFITGWMIKPIYSKKEHIALRKQFKQDSYDLVVKLTMMYISKQDFGRYETVSLNLKEKAE